MLCRAFPAAVALAVAAPVVACTGGPPFQHLAGPGKATLVAYHADLAELPRFTVLRDPPIRPRKPPPGMLAVRGRASVAHSPGVVACCQHRGAPSVPVAPGGEAARIACVIATENGGSYGRSSNPTHFGRYQFDRQTWAAWGGSPADWGYSSPAEQDAVFWRAVNAGALYQGWLRWDHC